ncbi:MAG: hypothetical protein K2X26_11720 [Chitinophagaceae bacterium]|jgi:hypothetical protein|nr:hypothetical protein [Chitinophagaceae bacterium]
MKIYLLIISLFTFIVSCPSNTQKNDNKLDTTKIKATQTSTLINNQNDNNLNKSILGIWTDGTTDNATFDIREDSIYYVDQLKTYKYFIDKDTIQINYSDLIYKAKIEIRNDTLMFINEDGASKFWHFKK